MISRQDVRRDPVVRRAWSTRPGRWRRSWVLAGGERLLPRRHAKKRLRPGGAHLGRVRARGPLQRAEARRRHLPALRQPRQLARSAKAWAVGLNWYLNRNLRLMFDYEHTKFEGGAATGDREDEKIFFSRFQIAF